MLALFSIRSTWLELRLRDTSLRPFGVCNVIDSFGRRRKPVQTYDIGSAKKKMGQCGDFFDERPTACFPSTSSWERDEEPAWRRNRSSSTLSLRIRSVSEQGGCDISHNKSLSTHRQLLMQRSTGSAEAAAVPRGRSSCARCRAWTQVFFGRDSPLQSQSTTIS